MSPTSVAVVGSLLADSNVFSYLCTCSVGGTFEWASSRPKAQAGERRTVFTIAVVGEGKEEGHLQFVGSADPVPSK